MPAAGLATMTSAASAGASLAGRYRLVEPVASGSAGQVWRAVDLVLERLVAVKLLWPETARDPEARARFRAEARNTSRLSHPAVAQVYDYGEDGSPGVPFLVMELVDGPSLAEVLAAGPLGPGQAMDVVAQVAAGLHAAHSAGLVHCDIKPANLLITADGLEGGAIYGLSAPLREAILARGEAVLSIDLRPDLAEAELAAHIARGRRKESLSTSLRKTAKLSPAAIDLLREAAAYKSIRLGEMPLLELAEASDPEERVPHDQQRPPLADGLEALGDGAMHLREALALHSCEFYHRTLSKTRRSTTRADRRAD